MKERVHALEELLTLHQDEDGLARADFSIGLSRLPYLADHGLQGMVVLAGSLYVEMARCIERRLVGRLPHCVRALSFERPIVLGAEDVNVRVESRPIGDGRISYSFHESASTKAEDSPAATLVARLVVDRGSPALAPSAGAVESIEVLEARPVPAMDAERFYTLLHESGNRYGPSFRQVAELRSARSFAIGRVGAFDAGGGGDRLPVVLDCTIQVLASMLLERGRTFVLSSIERIRIADGELPDRLWVHAVPAGEPDGGASFSGNVTARDRSGRTYLELLGVTLTLLDRVEHDERPAPTRCVIAANFTAEPVADSLEFWADHLGLPLRIEFAPHDQVFQQLLDPGSALRRNVDGTNVVLLDLEAWATASGPPRVALDRDRARRSFGHRSTYVLPNGLEILQLNRYETDYLYHEIFEQEAYLRHGIELRDGATVVDIGANIGMFSLFVISRCPGARILAFEPAPAAYELLKANCEAYAGDVRAVHAGVADRERTATLTFYERSSVFSGFHADEAADREAIRAVVRNALDERMPLDADAREAYVAELTADRLGRTTHECRLTSLSEIIREHGLDRIDLLKIDAERSEDEIVRGIEESDWPKLRQIVVEVHDESGETLERLERQLSARGFHCAVERERLLERSGLFNLYATRAQTPAAAEPRSTGDLARNARDLSAALRELVRHSTAPLVLGICPRSPAAERDPGLVAALDEAERMLLADASTLPTVHAAGAESLLSRYPVANRRDGHAERLGRMPYTPACYAAIGTALFRTLFNLRRSPHKAIVVDCDNTLWSGICGEDGPAGLVVGLPHRRLQERLIAQREAGMLLCLCSKNSEQDVLEVFERRDDMPLGRRHLTAWRINWNSKSDNLRSLADELGLGLDSFVFIDDNPLECAEVRASCPEVLTLELPQDTAEWVPFLDHVWVFDPSRSTAEDRQRARMYREAAERRKLEQRSGSLRGFIEGLELRIDVSDLAGDDLPRVSQLTYRTNQFNFTTVRRSEGEIREFLALAGAGGLTVRVSDRFGDYGLVGVVLYRAQAGRLAVDTFLLSCRVLGRGVEHAVLSELARRALEAGLSHIELGYRATARNLPAREFLANLAERADERAGESWIFAAERLASLEYDPDRVPCRQPRDSAARTVLPTPRVSSISRLAGPLAAVPERLRDVASISRAIEEHRAGRAGGATPAPGAPAAGLEAALLGIWSRVLGRPHIGTQDNFFDVGGTSLRAVQVIAAIQKELGRTLSIVSLFECPTVSRLAARLEGAAPAGVTAGEVHLRATQRGQRRRAARRRTA